MINDLKIAVKPKIETALNIRVNRLIPLPAPGHLEEQQDEATNGDGRESSRGAATSALLNLEEQPAEPTNGDGGESSRGSASLELLNVSGFSKDAVVSSSRYSEHDMELTFMSGEPILVSAETAQFADSFLRAHSKSSNSLSVGEIAPNISGPERMLSPIGANQINKTVD